MVCVGPAKGVSCKTKMWDTLISQKRSAGAEALPSLSKELGEPNE